MVVFHVLNFHPSRLAADEIFLTANFAAQTMVTSCMHGTGQPYTAQVAISYIYLYTCAAGTNLIN